jgi:hypothetical protein
VTTEGQQWQRENMKAKYMFMYAKDVEVTPRPDNTAVEHFRWKLGFWWFLLRNKAARDAVRADRFRFITITKDK